MTNLKGKYQISKSNLINASQTLIIAERKKPEINKPKRYLLLKAPQNKFEYVSSLYPSKEGVNCFEIDYKGVKYMLCLDAEKNIATIDMLEGISNGLSISMSISALQAHFSNVQNSGL
jgi:hypothetical protein